MGHHHQESVAVSDPALHLYDFQAFECNGCGKCCSKPWKVTIDPHQIAGIKASAAYKKKARNGYVPLAVDEGGLAKLEGGEGGGCVFLDSQKLCGLHAELGLYGKPRGCQIFPYQAQETPDGTYVHLSFSCPQVVAGQGGDARTNHTDLSHVLAYRRSLVPSGLVHPEGSDSGPVEEERRVALAAGQTISWSSYRKLEERILEGFDASNPCESLLKVVLGVLRCDASSEEWPALTDAREDVSFAAEMFARFLESITASLADEDSAEVWQRAEYAVTLSDLAAPQEIFLREILDRYVRNAVLGKSLLKTTVVERLLVCASVVALVGCYARACEAARGGTSLTLEAVTEAFDLMEVRVATHSRELNHVFAGMEETFAKIAALPVEFLDSSLVAA